jgi:hypothetical protein
MRESRLSLYSTNTVDVEYTLSLRSHSKVCIKFDFNIKSLHTINDS